MTREEREEHNRKKRAQHQKRMQDPVKRENESRKRKEQRQKFLQDPAYKEKENRESRENHKKYMKDPVYRERHRLNRHKRNITNYNITLEDYALILKEQNGCCKGCLKHHSEFKTRLSVDHDHKCCSGGVSCGKCIRGIFCFKCNLIMRDDIDSATLRRLADTIEQNIYWDFSLHKGNK